MSASRRRGDPRFETPVRAAARAEAKRLYPAGKALARLRYFEAQRGLAARVMPARHATPSASDAKGIGRVTKLPHVNPRLLKSEAERDFKASVGLPVWRELGPRLIPHGATYGKGRGSRPPVSGRCSGIDIDPANPAQLTLCSAGGGLWGSEDGGATWRPLTDKEPALAMGAIARSVSPPNIVYAATGDGDGQITYGGGLLRSYDSGQTWSYMASAALAGEGVYDIVVDPSDGLHVWIAGTYGLYETTDGGRTVRHVRSKMTWSVSINPSDSREIFIGCEVGLRRSVNAGRTWHPVRLAGVKRTAKLDRLEVCHAPSNPSIVYAAASVDGIAMLWRRTTTAGGFRRLNVPPRMDTSQAWYDWCLGVAPGDADILFWGAIELYRARYDNGRMVWRNISSRKNRTSIHPDQHDVAFDPSDAKTVYVCNDGGVFRSRDLGAHWESINHGLGITEIEFVAQLESDANWLIAGTQDNGTIANADLKHWQQIAVGDGGDCAASDGRDPLCFHSYYGMWIERAPAKGPRAFRWQDASPPKRRHYPAQFYPPMDVRGKLICKAGDTVFISPDSGRKHSWSEIRLVRPRPKNPDRASALTIISPNAILVGTENGMIYRIDGHPNGWAKARVERLTSPCRDSISDIIVDAEGRLWASSSTADRGPRVFRSADSGHTWTDRSAKLPIIPVNALVSDPADVNILYAATDHGVFCTVDGGESWMAFSNGFPNVIVGDLVLHETRRLLRAGTRGRGVWEVAI